MRHNFNFYHTLKGSGFKVKSDVSHLMGEVDELKKALESGQINEVMQEIGDVLLMAGFIAAEHGIDAEACLRASENKLLQRAVYTALFTPSIANWEADPLQCEAYDEAKMFVRHGIERTPVFSPSNAAMIAPVLSDGGDK